MVGTAVLIAENQKMQANCPKCQELGWAFGMDILSADLLDWLVEEDDKQQSEDLPIHTRPFAVPKT